MSQPTPPPPDRTPTGRPQAKGTAPFRRHFAELEVGPAAERTGVRRAALALAAAALTVLLFNSQGLATWALDHALTGGPLWRSVLTIADGWHSIAAQLGLTAPFDAIRAAVRRLQLL